MGNQIDTAADALSAFLAVERCLASAARHRAAKEGPKVAELQCDEHGCVECYFNCASAMIGVKVWTDELARLGVSGAMGRA
jgi:hypothetical protein